VAEEKPDLTGRFVTEVGLRQAWPFITLACCDAAGTDEIRVFIDTTFAVGSRSVRNLNDAGAILAAVAPLINLTVSAATIDDDDGLSIRFDDGSMLQISGAPTASTIGPPWWTGTVT
jgi:hypothetical protein